jgi:hypothetical protein
MNVKNIKAEVQILSQLSAGYCLFRILIRRRQHPHVNRSFHLTAKPPDFAVFQHAQQFCLRGRRHFANFVQ